MHRIHRRILLLTLALVGALIIAGCGSDGSSTTSNASGTDGGSLQHVDGTVELSGETLTVTPSAGGDPIELGLGPAIARGPLQALVASGAKSRVFYTSGDTPLAAKVEAAPTAEDGAQTYDGQVVKVSSSSITIDGDDGQRTFEIRSADREGFDTAHLKEHRAEGSAVRIYYRAEGGTDHAVAYEDA
jgi:hypothetical protein